MPFQNPTQLQVPGKDQAMRVLLRLSTVSFCLWYMLAQLTCKHTSMCTCTVEEEEGLRGYNIYEQWPVSLLWSTVVLHFM